MPSNSTPSIRFDASIVSQLACPACHGDLHGDAQNPPSRLVCTSCGSVYPIVDGIPALTVDRAASRAASK